MAPSPVSDSAGTSASADRGPGATAHPLGGRAGPHGGAPAGPCLGGRGGASGGGVVLLDGAVGPRIYPSKGIVAGSKTATTEAKIYVMPMLEDVSTSTDEQVTASIHIDDITSSAWAFGLEDCVRILWKFGAKLRQGLQALRLPLALDKLAITASSAPLLKRAKEKDLN